MSKKGITPKAAIDPVDRIVSKREQEQAQEEIHRVAFNMPKYIHDIVHPKSKKMGMTMTNYILFLIRKDIGEI
ncbi:MAG: hypothetical protein ACKVTZ_04285 [Bacteroidia bacterium]|jgi:hypothetical protein